MSATEFARILTDLDEEHLQALVDVSSMLPAEHKAHLFYRLRDEGLIAKKGINQGTLANHWVLNEAIKPAFIVWLWGRVKALSEYPERLMDSAANEAVLRAEVVPIFGEQVMMVNAPLYLGDRVFKKLSDTHDKVGVYSALQDSSWNYRIRSKSSDLKKIEKHFTGEEYGIFNSGNVVMFVTDEKIKRIQCLGKVSKKFQKSLRKV